MQSILLLILTVLQATYAKRSRPKPGKGGCEDCSWEYIVIAIAIVVALVILYFIWKYYKNKKNKTEDDSKSIASEMSVKDDPGEALPSRPYPEPVQSYPVIEPPPYPTPEQSSGQPYVIGQPYNGSGQPYNSGQPYGNGQPYGSGPGQPYDGGQPSDGGQPHTTPFQGYAGSPYQPYSTQDPPHSATEQPYPSNI